MLREAMPRLTTLRVDEASQMNLVVASRFRDVRELHINSLLRLRTVEDEAGEDEDELGEMELDLETKLRTVPFLSSRFHKLERLVFGGKKAGEDMPRFAPALEYFEGDGEQYPLECARERMLSFVDGLSAAFRCRLLPPRLKISGLCCPDALNCNGFRSDNDCETCLQACKSFPLQSVAMFESRGSSVANALSKRSYDLDVCLERATIESIIEGRPGGKELLHSKYRLLSLLSCGMRYTILSDDRQPFYIVKYNEDQLKAIQRAIDYADLDPKNVPIQEVSGAILRSFAANNCSVPPKDKCFLSNASLRHSTDVIGLGVDNEEICCTNLAAHAQQIFNVVRQCHAWRTNGEKTEYKDIEGECLGLIQRILEDENPLTLKAAIEQIIKSQVVPCLAKCLERSCATSEKAAAVSSLKNILVKGTKQQRNAVINVPSMIQLISDAVSSSSHAEDALLALVNIATVDTKGQCDMVACSLSDEKSIAKLLELLDSTDTACAKASLEMLVILAKKDSWLGSEVIKIETGLLSRILDMMLSDGWGRVTVANASFLLNKILDYYTRHSQSLSEMHIQQTVNSAVFTQLMSLLKETKDHAVETNLANAMIHLTAIRSTSPADVGSLVQEPVFVSVLERRLVSSDKTAIVAVGNLADGAPSCCRLLLKAGVVDLLLQILRQFRRSNQSKTLQVAALAYMKYCRGKICDLVSMKTGLEVLTELLESKNTNVVCNSCWALFHVLDGLKHKWALSAAVYATMVEGVLNIFLKNLLLLLPRASLETQEPIIKTLHLITTAGDVCIRTLTLSNGISIMMNQPFSRGDQLSQSESLLQKLVCSAISNMINNKEQLQVAIESGVIPSWVEMAAHGHEENKTTAMCALYQATKYGCFTQIKLLVNQHCLSYFLCGMLITDQHNCALTALLTLKNILKAGKKDAKPNNPNIQMIEHRLRELTTEAESSEKEIGRLGLLAKQKAWLEFNSQEELVNSANGVHGGGLPLEDHIEKTSSDNSEVPLEFRYGTQQEKERKAKTLLQTQCNMPSSLAQGDSLLEGVFKNTEIIAPNNECGERLANDELSAGLASVEIELEKAKKKVNHLRLARMSNQRKRDIDAIEKGFRELFSMFNDRAL